MYPSRREELGLWLNRNKLLGSGAEIGVSKGEFAKTIINLWGGNRLWLIDPWEKQDPSVYRESTNQTAPWSLWLAECKTLASTENRIGIMQAYSPRAASAFADHQLDFVYIDGNHSLKAVTEDMTAWWPKVKDGGIMGGHDFVTKLDEGWHCKVPEAVTEWAKPRLLTFAVTPCSSWWIRKI